MTTTTTRTVEPGEPGAHPTESSVPPSSPIPPVAPAHAVALSREQILEATFLCLRDDGYDGTTIRRIAQRLGCAVGSIYRYFRDKRELLYAVTQELLEPVAKLLELNGSVAQSAALYAKLATSDSQNYRLMFCLACQVTGRADDGSEQPARPFALPDVVVRILAQWERQLGSADKAQGIWARLHGMCTLGLAPDRILARVEAGPAAALPDQESENPGEVSAAAVAAVNPVADAAADLADDAATAPEVPTAPATERTEDVCLL